MKINVNSVNEFCKLYRRNILKLSLREVSEITGLKLSTLSSFENGRSNNLKYILVYYSLGNEEQREYFKSNLLDVL